MSKSTYIWALFAGLLFRPSFVPQPLPFVLRVLAADDLDWPWGSTIAKMHRQTDAAIGGVEK